MLHWYNQRESNAGNSEPACWKPLLKCFCCLSDRAMTNCCSANKKEAMEITNLSTAPPGIFTHSPMNKRLLTGKKKKKSSGLDRMGFLLGVSQVQGVLKRPTPASAQAGWAAVIKGDKQQDNREWSESGVTRGVPGFKDTASPGAGAHKRKRKDP